MVFRSWSRSRTGAAGLAAAVLAAGLLAGCRTVAPAAASRTGDEMIVAGQRFHTGTRIITWLDPGGYSAYRGAPAFSPRQHAGHPAGRELAALQGIVDQFVLHYDASGLSRICFAVLQQRGLSVHFLLDVDGTLYQTLDLRERAQHATIANDRSIGIEIANVGAYDPGDTQRLDEWYRRDGPGRVRLVVPAGIRDPGLRQEGKFSGRPDRAALIRGRIQGRELVQYDYTPEQYAALGKLTAALCRVFPRLRCDYPRDAAGRLITRKLSARELAKYRGLLGHYHIQEDKIDPGPALQWRKLVEAARQQRP